MTDYTRIKFAFARGARLQFRRLQDEKDWWYPSRTLSPDAVTVEYRIHPDDEHLQYGPVSSALREMAENGMFCEIDIGFAGLAVTGNVCEAYDFAFASSTHRSLWLLILAEALADEGM